jgi:hypothetical protein
MLLVTAEGREAQQGQGQGKRIVADVIEIGGRRSGVDGAVGAFTDLSVDSPYSGLRLTSASKTRLRAVGRTTFVSARDLAQ